MNTALVDGMIAMRSQTLALRVLSLGAWISLASWIQGCASPPSAMPLLIPQEGHGVGSSGGGVTAVAVSPDRRFLATGGDDGAAIIWDFETAAEICRFQNHSGTVFSVAFDAQSTRLLTGGWDGTARIFDLRRRKQLLQVRHDSPVGAACFSRDGKQFLTATGSLFGSTGESWNVAFDSKTGKQVFDLDNQFHGASLWDARSGKLIRRFDTEAHAVAFAPDGQRVLSGAGLWDLHGRGAIREFDAPHASKSASFAPDQRLVLLQQALFETDTGKKVRTFIHHRENAGGEKKAPGIAEETEADDEWKQDVDDSCLSADGTMAATVSGVEAVVWDVTSGRELTRIHFDREVYRVCFTPDGQSILLAGGYDALLYDARSGAKLREFRGQLLTVTNAGISTSGGTIFANVGRYRPPLLMPGIDISAWWLGDIPHQFPQEFLDDPVLIDGVVSTANASVVALQAVSQRDEDGLITELNQIVLRDLRGGRRFTFAIKDFVVSGPLLSPDGKLVLGTAAGPIDPAGKKEPTKSQAILWSAETGGELRRFRQEGMKIGWLMFSPDASLVLTLLDSRDSSTEGALAVLWDTQSGAKRHILEIGDESDARFSPDGKTLLTFTLHGGTTWDVASGKKQHELSFSDDGWATAFTFSQDSKRLVTGQVSGTICVWDLASGKQIKRFGDHLMVNEYTGGVRALAVSPDGKRIASGGGDCSVRLWNADTGKEVRRFLGHGGNVCSARFCDDGKSLLTAAYDGTIRMWDVSSAKLKWMTLFFRDGGWAVVDSAGRFDTNNLDNIPGLRWIFADDPFKSLPPEQYMRDYYSPRLLGQLLAGETLEPLPRLQDLNRARPRIDNLRVTRQQSSDTMCVSVDVAGGSYRLEDGSRSWQTQAYDLRLFRDGALVDQCPAERDDAAAPFSGSSPVDLGAWRQATLVSHQNDPRVHEHSDGSATVTFEVRVPHRAGQRVRFSLYAFNRDRVKGDTAETRSVAVPPQ